MGMKARPKGTDDPCVARIANLNRAMAPLIRLKDEAIDELQERCRHARLIEAGPAKGRGMPNPFARSPVRSCLDCAYTEFSHDAWKTLRGKARRVGRKRHAVMIGRLLKRLGIDL